MIVDFPSSKISIFMGISPVYHTKIHQKSPIIIPIKKTYSGL